MHVQHKKLESFLSCVTYKPPECPLICFDDFMDQYLHAVTYGKMIVVVADLNWNLLSSYRE